MEPISFAVGVIGLAGLFSSCLEAVDKVQTYRSFGSDSHVLDTRFTAAKVRLATWGRRVGFIEKALSEDHHPALDDRDIAAVVQGTFQIINTLCGASGVSVHRSSWDATPVDDDSLGSLRPWSHGARRRKLTWAFWGKTKRTDQVELFEKLVQQLHNLVPLDAVQGTRPVHELDTRRTDKLVSGLDHAWPAELQRILSRIEEANRANGAKPRRDEIYSWLGRGSPSELYPDSLQKRLVGTCDWIFHRPAFQNWLDQEFPAGAKLLWINGPAGFGKTILCAHVVEHLSSTLKTPVAHFFFSSDLESREDPFVAVRSWISQVVSQHEGAFEHVRQRWEANSDPVATRQNAATLFTQLLHVVPGCTFVVDGLDECTYLDNSNTSVPRFLHTVTDAVVGTNTRVLVVSRAEPQIRHALTDVTLKSFAEYEILPNDVRSDTAAYSRDIVDRKLPNKSDDLRSTLSEAMTDQCEGQFLWLKMQEKSLRRGMNKKQLKHAIEETPAGLDRLYDLSWQRITQSRECERQRIYALLRWAAFALRPLTVCEVTEAVLIDESEDLPIEDLPDAVDDDYIDSEIVGLCGPLLEVRSQHSDTSAGLRTVHLTHFSVKQYLLCNLPTPGWIRENERLRDEYQNTLLAKACLHYINFQRVWQESPDHPPCLGVTFRDYAAASWHHHVKSSLRTDGEISALAIRFLDRSNHAWNAWRAWFDERLQKLGTESTSPGPLYYAVELELTDVATALIKEQCCDVNERNDLGRSALEVACARGSKEVVKMLLDADADVSTAGKNGWTPLHSASLNGHIEVARLLIEKGASVTITDEDGYNNVVQALLADGRIDPGIKDWYRSTSLFAAVRNGHFEVVELFLAAGGMTIEGQDGFGRSLLVGAAHWQSSGPSAPSAVCRKGQQETELLTWVHCSSIYTRITTPRFCFSDACRTSKYTIPKRTKAFLQHRRSTPVVPVEPGCCFISLYCYTVHHFRSFTPCTLSTWFLK
ncbi:hypothetical protein B0J13DRAFT_591130 [Dactylonectria estremocensis]|uniref:Uncharacterized protein n=1 Tax=Dactylonectria estremocensis TaxID=1079267 RepID=A0A9P9D0L5_9HYPO|nr:hypothetical protein B0J13DRAFT_591130 [Dactylonectria estremocensis]